MNRSLLLKAICDTAYNVGYGAKLNFSTLDIAEKIPGFLGFVSLGIGVYALIKPALAGPEVAAMMILIGIISVYLAPYQVEKEKYDAAGKQLTSQYNALKKLYLVAKSRSDSDDLNDLIKEHDAIQAETVNQSHSKQVLFSDWYAHYKFFWQQQIGWVDEQKHFSFFRDKVPLTAWIALLVSLIGALGMTIPLLECFIK